jgi:hypothetical protein
MVCSIHTRILFLGDVLRSRQQQPGFDLHQHRGHDEVLCRELEITVAHRLDVGEVLLGHPRHRDVEDVDVRFANQVEKQVERSLEGLQENLQGVRRDVEIGGNLHHRFAPHERNPLRAFRVQRDDVSAHE